MNYGFTLPRNIVSTEFSRGIQVAGVPVHQAPISAFLRSQIESWPLRLIASGKPVAVEVFRSKQEAVFHSLLAKQMRDNQPHVELNEVVKFIHQKHGHEKSRQVLLCQATLMIGPTDSRCSITSPRSRLSTCHAVTRHAEPRHDASRARASGGVRSA